MTVMHSSVACQLKRGIIRGDLTILHLCKWKWHLKCTSLPALCPFGCPTCVSVNIISVILPSCVLCVFFFLHLFLFVCLYLLIRLNSRSVFASFLVKPVCWFVNPAAYLSTIILLCFSYLFESLSLNISVALSLYPSADLFLHLPILSVSVFFSCVFLHPVFLSANISIWLFRSFASNIVCSEGTGQYSLIIGMIRLKSLSFYNHIYHSCMQIIVFLQVLQFHGWQKDKKKCLSLGSY